MKKVILAIVLLLVLCVGCCVGLYYFRGSIPVIKEIKLGNMFGIDLDQNISDPSDSDTSDSNYKVNIDDINIDVNKTNKTWPSDMPTDVPKFVYGEISSVSEISNNDAKIWSIEYQNIDVNAQDDYKRDLDNAGFMNSSTFETSDGWVISGVLNNVAVVAAYSSDQGTLSLSVTIELLN